MSFDLELNDFTKRLEEEDNLIYHVGVGIMSESINTLRALTEQLIEKDRSEARWAKRFRAVLEIIPDGILLTKNRMIIYANKGITTITGYEVSELLGKNTRVLYYTEKDWSSVGEGILNCLELKERVSIRKKDGTAVACLLQTKMIDIEDLEMIVLLCDQR